MDRALRLDTEVMLVDDPVKRVDNMTMGGGLEARVPFPTTSSSSWRPSARPSWLAGGGKGVLKDAARSVIPGEVIDRPKGYFPVPALVHLEGPYLALVEEALRSDRLRARVLSAGVRRAAARASQRGADDTRRLAVAGGAVQLWLQAHGL